MKGPSKIAIQEVRRPRLEEQPFMSRGSMPSIAARCSISNRNSEILDNVIISGHYPERALGVHKAKPGQRWSGIYLGSGLKGRAMSPMMISRG